jgi:hypothetical protein
MNVQPLDMIPNTMDDENDEDENLLSDLDEQEDLGFDSKPANLPMALTKQVP